MTDAKTPLGAPSAPRCRAVLCSALCYEPGVAPRNHRTSSIDYAVVLEGEIDMEIDATTVTLRAGDVLVQRGTIHNWVNRGVGPCTIAFVLVDAKPVEAGGRVLDAIG